MPLSGVTLSAGRRSGWSSSLSPARSRSRSASTASATPAGSRPGRDLVAVLPLFVSACCWCPPPASVTTFLALWELMALDVARAGAAEHRRRPAGARGRPVVRGDDPARLRRDPACAGAVRGRTPAANASPAARARPRLSPAVRSAVFVLTLVGFGSKAGVVPLHAWLPRAHPEAPSHVSALMRAAMVNLGVYGMVRVDVDLLGGGPRWWWLLLVIAGGAAPRCSASSTR